MMNRIEEAEAKELLARMAKSIGFELVEMPEDAWYKKHWCFSNGRARYTKNYFSINDMLRLVLLSKDFHLVPGTWELGVPLNDSYQNPFYKLSLEELCIKLDLEEAATETKNEE